MTQSSYKIDTKSKNHPGMKLAPVRVFSCKQPLRQVWNTVSNFWSSPKRGSENHRFWSEIGWGFQETCRTPHPIFLEVPSPPGDCVNSARTAKDRDVTAHAYPTFAWADLTTERERQLTTGNRFRCQFAALLFDLHALSTTDVPVLLLNQPRVVFARGFVVMTSRSSTVRPLFTRYHFALYVWDYPRHQ